ncbi:aldehyde dehydrogenase family protein [Cytobacillus oceanisediminis]|uniref:3-sulfolactaldehyde dehydrogenase n=1 Tax=Cytobacillus oceanisediminis TaxID=665099 RepID=A0A562JGK7_9BACI|nr:aldehyde dehydrogenase family protein [Cytobacillus oceanisediminis]TWH82203.1 acyl-CoA reductase-like NAD-dependent aldehyde dehydrogenase [Cytobacillus oceanisediminis]
MMIIGSIINGKERSETHRETLEVRNPYNQEIVAEIALADKSDMEEAVNNSVKTFETTMKKMPAFERAEILRKAADILEEKAEDFAAIIMQEAGKPIKHSRAEVKRSIQILRFASELSKNITGEVLPMDAALRGENRMGMVKRTPIGPVGAITPFNFPLNLSLHKIAPAIAAGNTVIFKPAEKTPVSAYMLVKLFEEAGLPDGVLNLVLGTGETVGAHLTIHKLVPKITFTGSLAVGKMIRDTAGLKKVTMELGSNSPNLIFEDADLDNAVDKLVMAAFGYSGQVCVSAQRIYVHQSIYEQFLEKFIKATNKLKIGDPREESTDIGPMIDEGAASKTKAWIDEARDQGAKVETGGEQDGTVVSPTILTSVKSDMKVVSDEAFAPLVSVMPFETEEEAIQRTNDSVYGLQAGVFTKDINRAIRVADSLEMGGVWINEASSYRQDNYPYGGVKESGIGREGVKYAIDEMTEMKFIGINLKG